MTAELVQGNRCVAEKQKDLRADTLDRETNSASLTSRYSEHCPVSTQPNTRVGEGKRETGVGREGREGMERRRRMRRRGGNKNCIHLSTILYHQFITHRHPQPLLLLGHMILHVN